MKLVLAFTALMLAAAAHAAPAGPVRVHTRNVCPNGTGTRQMEPALAVRDSVVVVSFNDRRGACPLAGWQGAGWAYSLDGGAVFHEGGPLPGGTRWSADQWLAVGPDGAFYHSALSNEGTRHGVMLSRGVAQPSGITWSEPIVYLPPIGSCDKPSLAIDPATGRAYLAFTVFAGTTSWNGLWVLRSDDAAGSFGAPVKVASNPTTSGANAAYALVELDGSLAIAWKTGRNTDSLVTIWFARSTDGGQTFGAQAVVGTACTFNAPGTDGSPVFPQLAQDTSTGPRRGALYLAWQTACPRAGITVPGDFVVTRSDDHGGTWSAPVVANSDSGSALHVQPALAVDAVGRPWLFGYRATPMGDSSVATFVRTRSSDDGASFDPIADVAGVPSTWGVTAEAGPQNYGEYVTAVAAGGRMHVVWCDARDGDPDVYWASFDASEAAAAPPARSVPSATLDSVAPNPGRSGVRIRFALAHPAESELAVYDVSGRLVRQLAQGRRDAGAFTSAWNLRDESGRRVPPGVYQVRLRAGGATATRSVVVTR